MKTHLKQATREILTKDRAPDIALTMIIISLGLYLLTRNLNTSEPLAQLTLLIAGITITTLTLLITILIKAIHQKLKNTQTKGFTLVEMIVVITVIAILIAALTPALLGVINRARLSADEADARNVLIMASVVTISATGANLPPQTGVNNFQYQMNEQLTGGNFRPGSTFTIYFMNEYPISVIYTTNARTTGTIIIGQNPIPTGAAITTRTFTTQ